MNELIKITEKDGQQLVSARTLHEFLEIGTEFSVWFPRMCEYGFVEGDDFSSFLMESIGGRTPKDFAINLDMAKEISMIQRNAKGKQARRYFIEFEKKHNKPMSLVDNVKLQANLLVDHDQRIAELEAHNDRTKGYLTVMAWCNINNQPVTTKTASVMGKKATGVAARRYITVEKVRDQRYGNVNAYPEELLDELFK